MTIELATVARAADCARISRAARKQALPYLPDLHSADEYLNFFANRVFGKDTVFIALDEDRQCVGFIAFGDGWVNHLYVLPGHQGLGIGGLLLDKAKQSAQTLRLWTFERNERALRFYRKRGFSVIDRTDGARNEEQEPDLLLQWDS
jgi:GNAT superfamily N-acetyltransferase